MPDAAHGTQGGRGAAAVCGRSDEVRDGRGRGRGGGKEGVSTGGPDGGTEGNASRPQAAVAQDGLQKDTSRTLYQARQQCTTIPPKSQLYIPRTFIKDL